MEHIAEDHPESKLELTKTAYGYQDHDEINAIVRVLHEAFGEDAKLYSESNGTGNIALDFDPNGEKHANTKKQPDPSIQRKMVRSVRKRSGGYSPMETSHHLAE